MTLKIEEKSLQLALVKAARILETTQDQLNYKIINENLGIFGVFGKKVVVEVWIGKGKNSDDATQNSDEKRKFSAAEISEVKSAIEQFCQGICKRIAGEDVKIISKLNGERLILDIKHPFFDHSLNKHYRFSESMEHLLRKGFKNLKQELPFRIFVDMGGYRQTREEELITMAKDLSNKVHDNKRPIVLNYQNSYDRKVIHMALDGDDRVYTKSIGSGPNRKLMILPQKADDTDR